jgi:tricorn protease-like protein
LEDEIWEKFYKKDNFNKMSNSITFSENMLNLIVNKDINKTINKINSKDHNDIINTIKDESKYINLNKENINEIVKPFKNSILLFKLISSCKLLL